MWNMCCDTLSKPTSGTWHPNLRRCGGHVTNDDEEQVDIFFLIVSGHEVPFEEKFKIKNFWKDISTLINKDVPWESEMSQTAGPRLCTLRCQ